MTDIIDGLGVEARRKRFSLFKSLVEDIPGEIRILDVGGEPRFWEDMAFFPGKGISVTILNIKRQEFDRPGFDCVLGDARDMTAFADGEFDAVFSNAVIQMVGGFDEKRRMVAEIERVAKRYFIQSPNRRFPVHYLYLVPFFHFLPERVRLEIMIRLAVGRYGRLPNRNTGRNTLRRDILLDRRELESLFPRAEICEEKVLGITKSYIACRGWAVKVPGRITLQPAPAQPG